MQPLPKLTFILLLCIFVQITGCQESKSRKSAGSVSPDKVAALLDSANQSFQQEQFNQALALIDSLQQIAPENAEVYFLKGIILDRLKRFSEAQTAYEKVLELNPDYEGVRFNLGNLYFSRGLFKEAINYYRQEHMRYPAPNILVNIGLSYANLHQTDSARVVYQEAITLDSSFADAYMLLGQELKNDGELDKALEVSLKGLALSPDNASFLSIVGGLLLQNGQVEKAVPYLEKAVAVRPWGYRPTYNLGLAYERMGNKEQSEKHLAKADTLRRLQSRVSHLQMQVQNNPEEFMRWVELGETLREMENYTQSRDALLVAHSLQPGSMALQNNIAYLSLTLGDTLEAIQRFHDILSADSSQTDVWFNLGVVLTETGKTREAISAWKHVLEQTPGDTTAQNYLSRLRKQ